MAHRDVTSTCRTVDDLSHLKGKKGIYIMYQCLTGFVKVGRTYNIGKRLTDLSPFCSPHILTAFFLSENYGAIEKAFHYAHSNRVIDREYFEIDLNSVYDWFTSQGLVSIHQASIEEYTFQLIRANWIRAKIGGEDITLTNYLNVVTGFRYGRRSKAKNR